MILWDASTRLQERTRVFKRMDSLTERKEGLGAKHRYSENHLGKVGKVAERGDIRLTVGRRPPASCFPTVFSVISARTPRRGPGGGAQAFPNSTPDIISSCGWRPDLECHVPWSDGQGAASSREEADKPAGIVTPPCRSSWVQFLSDSWGNCESESRDYAVGMDGLDGKEAVRRLELSGWRLWCEPLHGTNIEVP